VHPSEVMHSDLSTGCGRGGLDAPRAAADGGQVAPPMGADQQASGVRAAPAGRLSPSPPGLVRLETSDTHIVGRYAWLREEQQRRRGLHMFKSLSCVGDILMEERAADGRRLSRAFLTFTYRPGIDWQPRHITECLKRMRHWVERRGVRFRYVWVAELTKAGRVHYHAIIWLPRGLTMPKPDKQGWWPHGFTNVQWARSGIGYLVKYATKTAASVASFPRGCRLHGHGGLTLERRVYRAWWMLPKYQRERCEPVDRVHRARGGGWRSKVTGQWWEAVTCSIFGWQPSPLASQT
jgi:hypothetical protein